MPQSPANLAGEWSGGVVRASNRYGWDYGRAGAALGPPCVPIIDAHAHLAGAEACRVYDRVRRLFGVERTYTMTQLAQAPVVRDTLGDSARFIAFPSFGEPDRYAAFRAGYIQTIEAFHRDYGSRMLKLWASPRLRDLIPELADQGFGATDLAEVDSHWRIKACEVGQSLGMMIMIHIADPDTWFKARYTDASRYGTKRQQYEGLERMLDQFPGPWIAAHMGGWPEDLAFLDGLLTRHPNLSLDTSATKWVVRAVGGHPVPEARAFFVKWGGAGRLLFGSDIVVQEDHLRPQKQGVSPMADLADSPEGAFDLYASRYWATRAMFETSLDLDSPIADPDLMMLEPTKHDAMSAPRLRGLSLPASVLRMLYRGAAENLVESRWK
ncbi:MAG TPA: amidohydrolase family protein [Phycisphaerales bacterium]|nr:amidohydrolase family protein [Phycisphaerales bacterium]